MRGLIFDIQRFSTHDGPGIRTTVFFKGCPLRCFWCHNPESIKPHPELLIKPEGCIGCAKCVEVCPNGAHFLRDGEKEFDRSKCTGCGLCAQQCPPKVLTLAGNWMDVDEVMDVVRRDKAFYERSGGGVTVSGGETLLQADFVKELLVRCKEEGIHTAVDTAGDVPYANIEKVLPYANLFLYDVKAGDGETHRKGTGSGNERILENLAKLCATGAKVRIRVPVVPGLNDNAQQMEKIAAIVGSLTHVEGIDLLCFHRMGAGKYDKLGLPYGARELTPPGEETMQELSEVVKAAGYPVQIL